MLDNTESKKLYTTGEAAQVCGVTVRTVQYYDQRGLLHPTERSDGGRRLYDDETLSRLRTICTLKALGLPLKAIRGVLGSDNSDEVLRCLLEEQEKQLEGQLEANRQTLDAVRTALAELGGREVQGDAQNQSNPSMDHTMSKFFADRDTRLYQTQRKALLEGIVLDLVEVVCIYIGVTSGNWVPFLAALPLMVIIAGELVWMYHRDARYVCSHCHTEFQPTMRSFFFAAHTPKTRKLTCTNCGTKDWCIEVGANVSPAKMLKRDKANRNKPVCH